MSSRRWYRYYAGFAPEFVDDICGQLSRPTSVLDPWMGSGTTLAVAASRGLAGYGVDLNPAMVAIARGRLLADDTIASVEPLRVDLIRHWVPSPPDAADPLNQWFVESSVRDIRGLANRLDELLIKSALTAQQKAEQMSSLAAFFYVALFETVTGTLKAYSSRNPTWIKRGEIGSGTIDISRESIEENFSASVRRLLFHIRSSKPISIEERDGAHFLQSDSRNLPFDSNSHDLVVSSPPYLTRLDYVVGHLPELAVLGFDSADIRELRDRMIGTPTMGGSASSVTLGSHVDEFLDRMASHPSKAARSYYEPNFRKYFEGMADSIDEIERVTRPGSPVVLVVQDSRFKDLHIDLATSLTRMAEHRGWRLQSQRDFENVRSMAQVNKRAHDLARTTKPVESVLSLITPN